MKGAAFVATALAAITPAGAIAQSLDLKTLCKPAAGAPDRAIDPIALVYAAVSASGGPSAGVFDLDADGTETMDERISAIMNPRYCSGPGKARCQGGDQSKLDLAREHLSVVEDSAKIKLVPLREPSALEMRESPLLRDETVATSARALDPRGRFYRLSCTESIPMVEAEPQPKKKRPPRGGLRVTSDIDSLGLPRGGPDELAEVPQAEISYLDDKEGKKETFDISAVVGYDLSRNPLTSFIPFIELKRKRVKDTSPPDPAAPPAPEDDGDLSKVSLGLTLASLLESRDELSFSPLLAMDGENDSRVGAVRFSWVPGLLQEAHSLPFGRSRRIGPLAWKLDATALAQAGHVFDAGTSDELKEQKDYLRLGPQVKLIVWSFIDAPILNHLSADARYKRLFAIAGDRVTWFDAGVNYSFAKTDHVTLRYSYERGVDDETLERSENWKLSLGIRF